MGTDIHVNVEVRSKETGKWERLTVKNPYKTWKDYETGKTEMLDLEAYSGRDYELFGILAGVRNDTYPQIMDVRGLPSDVSDGTRAEYDKYADAWHTCSWMTVPEMDAWASKKKNFRMDCYECLSDCEKKVADKDSKFIRKRFKNFVYDIRHFVDMLTYYTPDEDVRIVFWFDS